MFAVISFCDTSCPALQWAVAGLNSLRVQKANEMNSPYLTRTVFVQSGASRSIVIESPRSFRLLYLPPSPSSASRALGRSQKFILQSFRAAALFTNIYSFWSRHTVPHDFILSPRQRAFFHARRSWKIGTPLDVATAIPEHVFGIRGRSGKENARGGYRDYRAVIRRNTASVSGSVDGKEGRRERRDTRNEREREEAGRARNFGCRWPRSSCCFWRC